MKKIAACLSPSLQQELKRHYYSRKIRSNKFSSPEREFALLDQLVSAGDWVIDIGANLGRYTKRLSDLVGPTGRVIAFEPIPATFALLAANATCFQYSNVTLLNLAASDHTDLAGMQIPDYDSVHLKNYHRAALSSQAGDLQALTMSVDSMTLNHRISFIKIDAEGHDPIVVEGLKQVIQRDHPAIVIETESTAVMDYLTGLGYAAEKLDGSSNTIFRSSPRDNTSRFDSTLK